MSDALKTIKVSKERSEEIISTRNKLTCWVLGKTHLTLPEVSDLIIKLDNLLQDVNL